MAAIPLDALTPVYGSYPSSLPVSAGVNRWAYAFITHGSGTDANPPTTVTRGGVPPTLMVSADGASWDVTNTLALWNEAAITAGEDDALVISGGAFTAGNQAVLYGSVQTASQVTPTPAVAAQNGTAGNLSLARVEGGYTIAVTAHDIQNAYSSTVNPSISGQSDFSPTNTTAWGVEASTNETVDFTWNNPFARDNAAIVVNFAPSAATGPTVSSITNPASDSMTVVLSEAAATVDTISITYGGVTQSQSYTTGDDTTFTIASLTRNLLPPTGTTTVTLLAGVTEITSTTTVLDDIPGWETTDLVSPVTTEGSVFYNHTGATPVTGDKVRHNDPGNTTISATGILTQTTPRTVTVEAWDDSDETYGSLGTFTYSAGGGLSIIKSGIITQGLITSGLIQ